MAYVVNPFIFSQHRLPQGTVCVKRLTPYNLLLTTSPKKEVTGCSTGH